MTDLRTRYSYPDAIAAFSAFGSAFTAEYTSLPGIRRRPRDIRLRQLLPRKSLNWRQLPAVGQLIIASVVPPKLHYQQLVIAPL